MVEVSQPPRKARLVAACTYPCEEGLTVKTETQVVRRSRRLTVELLLAEAFDIPEIQALAHDVIVACRETRVPGAHSHREPAQNNL